MPGERATVELTLCGVLPYADGEVTFRFPLVVAPRYIPGIPLPGGSVGDGTAVDTDAVPDASRISPPVLLPGFPNAVRLDIELELHDGGVNTQEVRSSLHAVQEDARDGYRRLRVQPGERLDRDFIVRFRLGGAGIRSTLTLHPDADGNEGTFALTIVPPAIASHAQARPRDVVFVLDRSGSMEGWKMVAARRAVARMIDTLGDADRFCVVAFDSSVETPASLPSGLSAAADRNRFRAVEYLATVNARGGTEMAEPLDRAVRLLTPAGKDDRDRILVLITDGQVGNEDQLLETLGTRLRKIRVFTIGIDRAVNEGFLRRLAERGGGSCELVESEDRLDEVMASIRCRVGTPLLTGLGLETEHLTIEPGEVVPRRLPDLFAGSPVLILGRYRGRPEGSIAIRGSDRTGAAYHEPVAARVRENPAIAAAWARGQIRQLEDRYAAGDGDRSNLEKAIVGLSLKFQVLCKFTAYVAIDRSQAVNVGGSVHQVTQPVEMPQGWASAAGSSLQTKLSAVRRSRGSADHILPCSPLASSARGPQNEPPPREAWVYSLSSPDLDTVADESACFALASLDTGDGMPLPPPSSAARTLADRLRTDGRIPPRDAAAFIAEMAEAVQKVHDSGAVHGTITPHQVLLDSDGHLQSPGLLFGQSQDGDSPEMIPGGISSYTPPEWLESNGDMHDPRGDVYTLGVILYEMLTGQRPFSKDHGALPLAAEILGAAPTPPRKINRSIPAALEAICLKAMAKDPAGRYATAGELAATLREFLTPRKRRFWKR